MLHIEVAPTPPAAATAQATARRILGGVRVQYLPSGQVARRLHMSSRTLGKITGQRAIDLTALQNAETSPSCVCKRSLHGACLFTSLENLLYLELSLLIA